MATSSSESATKEQAQEQKNPSTPLAANSAPSASANAPAAPVQIDDSHVVACYANFCRVTGTPEELIVDFGLNSQPMGVPTAPIVATQRVVTNYFTAKRLLHALQMTLQRHEAAFGVLETNVQKRVQAHG